MFRPLQPVPIGALLCGLLIFAGAGCFSPKRAPEPPPSPAPAPIEDEQPHFDTLGTPKKTPHFVSTTPAHGATFAAAPVNVVVDVDFDLGEGSDISVLFAGAEFGSGDTTIDDNKLAMRRAVAPDAPDGLYTVIYKACWPDGSCHDGSFQFFIDRVQAITFEDLRERPEVVVRMVDGSFVPEKMLVSRGTRVVWINEDDTAHYVNTDPHAGHTYFPPQNSAALRQGDEYAVAFAESGHYLYHCSAHAATMEGEILVE